MNKVKHPCSEGKKGKGEFTHTCCVALLFAPEKIVQFVLFHQSFFLKSSKQETNFKKEREGRGRGRMMRQLRRIF